MAMTFQGPPPPPPAWWREPAFWMSAVALFGASCAFVVGSDLVRVAALLSGSMAVAGYNYYRMARREPPVSGWTRLKRGAGA